MCGSAWGRRTSRYKLLMNREAMSIWDVGVCKDVKTFSKDAFEFREARMVYGNKGAGIWVLGTLVGHDGVRMEDTEICFVVQDGRYPLVRLASVGMEVISLAADSPFLDGQKKGKEHLLDEGQHWRIVGGWWV